jgi:hypothetical protein
MNFYNPTNVSADLDKGFYAIENINILEIHSIIFVHQGVKCLWGLALREWLLATSSHI